MEPEYVTKGLVISKPMKPRTYNKILLTSGIITLIAGCFLKSLGWAVIGCLTITISVNLYAMRFTKGDKEKLKR